MGRGELTYRLMTFHLAVLNRSVAVHLVELDGEVGSGTRLILARVSAEPEVEVVLEGTGERGGERGKERTHESKMMMRQ